MIRDEERGINLWFEAILLAGGIISYILLGINAIASGIYYNDKVVEKVLRIHDGDTIYVNLANCIHPLFCDNIGIRIRGIDTPELWTTNKCEKKLAIKATNLMKELFKGANRITLTDVGRDKYFRIDARVLVDGVDVGKKEIEAGLAHKYNGGTKTKWCENGK